jgi:hypothetical protein
MRCNVRQQLRALRFLQTSQKNFLLVEKRAEVHLFWRRD